MPRPFLSLLLLLLIFSACNQGGEVTRVHPCQTDRECLRDETCNLSGGASRGFCESIPEETPDCFRNADCKPLHQCINQQCTPEQDPDAPDNNIFPNNDLPEDPDIVDEPDLPKCMEQSCTTPPPTCEGPEAITYEGGDSCNQETGTCTPITETRVDCTIFGATCMDGECTGACPNDMVEVPSGYFSRGSTRGIEDESPPGAIYLRTFCIDTLEVTVQHYMHCVNDDACPAPLAPEDSPLEQLNWDVTGIEDHPINGISWEDARLFCQWAGKRLPTEAEWEKAARGDNGNTFPWGDENANCFLAVLHDPNEGNGCGLGGTSPVGSKPAGASPYGAHDMAGNLWEWTADWYDPYAYRSDEDRNPTGPETGTRRVIRGGSWGSAPHIVQSSNRDSSPPETRSHVIGFRCAL